MENDNYFSSFKIKSILEVKNNIEKVLIIKNKYFIVKCPGEILIYSIKTNKLHFKIILNEKKNENEMIYNAFIFDLDYKLRLINDEKNSKICKLLTDKYLIEVNFNTKEWKIISKIEKGIYIYNLDVFIEENAVYILDNKGNLKKQFPLLGGELFGFYEIKDKYLIVNFDLKFLILDINNNYEILYSRKNCCYDFGYKHPYILDYQTIIFSSILNPYIENSREYIFLDLNNIIERFATNAHYYDYEYDSCNKLFLIYKFKDNVYLQYEKEKSSKRKRWSIVEEKNNKFSFIKKIKDNNILGDNLFFLSKNLLITWNFYEKTIKFVNCYY